MLIIIFFYTHCDVHNKQSGKHNKDSGVHNNVHELVYYYFVTDISHTALENDYNNFFQCMNRPGPRGSRHIESKTPPFLEILQKKYPAFLINFIFIPNGGLAIR